MNKQCILVVDDDPMILGILEAAFGNLDCNIIRARNGQEALELCVKKLPNLIISDWKMPVLNGIDLFFHIKNTPTLQLIPFILISGLDDDETKVALLENGLEDYWKKPLNIKEIVIKTKKILSRLLSPQKVMLQSTNEVGSETDKAILRVPVHSSAPNLSRNLPEPIYNEPSETYLYVNRVLDERYRLLRPIGRGGMGIVYQVEDLAERRLLALKLLRREYSSNEVEVRRFYREATATSQIKHPNVIEIYEYGKVASGQVFITMEILTGRSLMSELVDNTPKPAPPIKLMEQICLGVFAAHQQGIIHRDLKPNNIFLLDPPVGESIVKVLDFGIALLQPKAEELKKSERFTDPNILIGTPEYMSPEQALKREVGKESDIYSLGMIFYEILAGALPFIGDSMEVLRSQVKETPTPLSEIIPISAVLSDLVMSMLEKSPEMRPSLEKVLNILRKYSS